LLDVVQLLEHEGDIHFRFAREPLAAAVHPVLADERQRVGEEIHRDGQAAPGAAHHGFVLLERVAMLVED